MVVFTLLGMLLPFGRLGSHVNVPVSSGDK